MIECLIAIRNPLIGETIDKDKANAAFRELYIRIPAEKCKQGKYSEVMDEFKKSPFLFPFDVNKQPNPVFVFLNGDYYEYEMELMGEIMPGTWVEGFNKVNVRELQAKTARNLEEKAVEETNLSPGDRKLIRDVAKETVEQTLKLNSELEGFTYKYLKNVQYNELALRRLEEYGFKIKQRETMLDVELRRT